LHNVNADGRIGSSIVKERPPTIKRFLRSEKERKSPVHNRPPSRQKLQKKINTIANKMSLDSSLRSDLSNLSDDDTMKTG
jgi:hypothetical protein